MYINKAMVFGNLTRDPELRSLPSGVQVSSFSLATNRVYKDKDGNKQEQADYHNIVVFGRQAELVNQYLSKGSSAYIEGRMQTRSWEQEGQKKYRTEIIGETVQFGPRGTGAGQQGGSTVAKGDEESEPKSAKDTGNSGIEYPEEDIDPDDIPF